MNKWVKRSLKLALFCIAFNTLEHFCHVQTDGFSLSRIQFRNEQPQPNSPDPETLAALSQTFRYLDCGNQCFAFISADGQYVLKFFKYVDHTPPPLLSKLPFLHYFKPFKPQKLQKIAWKRERDFRGYQLAFDQFRSESGLLALHLHPSSNTYPTIKLYDKLRIVHLLDLNNTPFVLQKMASPVYVQFSAWLQNDEIDKVKQGIDSLVGLCAQRLSKNILDDDVHFYSNFGFVGETPIQIDPGHFTLGSPNYAELASLTLELKQWFAEHHPDLVPYVEAAAQAH
jgi:hypothetical protein